MDDAMSLSSANQNMMQGGSKLIKVNKNKKRKKSSREDSYRFGKGKGKVKIASSGHFGDARSDNLKVFSDREDMDLTSQDASQNISASEAEDGSQNLSASNADVKGGLKVPGKEGQVGKDGKPLVTVGGTDVKLDIPRLPEEMFWPQPIQWKEFEEKLLIELPDLEPEYEIIK